jgi:hypothetical protein
MDGIFINVAPMNGDEITVFLMLGELVHYMLSTDLLFAHSASKKTS